MTRADNSSSEIYTATNAVLSAGEVLVADSAVVTLVLNPSPLTMTVPLLAYDHIELEPFSSMSREQVAKLYATLSEWRESVDLDGAPTLRERDRALYRFLTQISKKETL